MLASVFEAYDERWGPTNELLATLIELVDRGDRWFFMANSGEDATPPDPIVVHRPGERSVAGGETETAQDDADEPTRRPATAAEMKAFFGGAVQYDPGG